MGPSATGSDNPVRPLGLDGEHGGAGVKAYLRNEFAHVCLEVDESANGARLRVTDVRTNKVFHLDPLELESLAWATHADLTDLVDPSLTRWRDEQDGLGKD